MKIKLTWSTISSLVCLLFALLLGSAQAATIKISQEPTTSTIRSADILLIDQSNGDGTYTTKTVSFGNLGLSGQTTQYVTNLYVSIEVVTNLYVTTNQVNQSFVTNQFVTTSYTTNLYVTTEVATNITVTQVFKGNQTFITNLTVTASQTNLNLAPQSIVVTDPNDAFASLTNNSAYPTHAMVHGFNPPIFYPFVANDLLVTQTAMLDATNYMIDLSLYPYGSLTATNAINFLGVTNGPGALSLKIFPNGADRVLTFPTNWIFLRTNNLILSGSFWKYTLTNASNGSGPRIGWLSVAHDGISTSQTNVVALFQESP